MKRLNQVPLSLKIGLLLGGLIVLGLSVQSRMTLSTQQQLIETQFSQSGFRMTHQLAESAIEPLFTDDALMLGRLVNSLLQLDQVQGVGIVSVDGTSISAAGLIPGIEQLNSIPNWNNTGVSQSKPWTDSDNGGPFVSFISPISFQDINAGYALVVMSRKQISDTLQRSETYLMVNTSILMFLLVVGVLWFSRVLTRPLKELVRATRIMGKGDFSYRITTKFSGDFKHLVDSFNSMAGGIEQKWQVEKVLNRLVPDQVAQQYLNIKNDIQLGSKRVQATILFADIVGFTPLSERLEPEAIESILNEFFSTVSDIASGYGGFVDKYIGDEAMVIFGIPGQKSDHKLQALQAAIEIQKKIHTMDFTRHHPSINPVKIKIGIASGTVLAGLFGANDRMQYTLIGDQVNLASRLTTLANPGHIMVTADIADRAQSLLNFRCSESQPVRVKGKLQHIETRMVYVDSDTMSHQYPNELIS